MDCNCPTCRAHRINKESVMARRRAATLARIELDARAGLSINHTLATTDAHAQATAQYVAAAGI